MYQLWIHFINIKRRMKIKFLMILALLCLPL